MTQNQVSGKRLKLAGVVTAIWEYSHPQHILDRFLDGYGWNGRFHQPNMDLVGLYVDQRAEGDLTRQFAQRFPQLKLYPTIEEAVTLGTGKLAVDGIVVSGEHGIYPHNALGQAEQPHYRFFQSIVDVFRSSGRSVPYLNDKQLASWSFPHSLDMVNTSKKLGFPMTGGSSLPVTWRVPSVEFPDGAKVREAMSVCYGGPDSYDYHALEAIQCMVERRQGGEAGVEWIQAYRGDNFWQAYANGVWPHALVKACLARSFTLTSGFRLYRDVYPAMEQMKQLVRDPFAYRYRCRDGLMCTMIMMNGLLYDFNFAADIVGRAEPFSTQMYSPGPNGQIQTLADFFNPLVHNAEVMFETGKAPFPIERVLMSTGLTIAGVKSLFNGQVRVETPELAAVRYPPSPDSTFWRS